MINGPDLIAAVRAKWETPNLGRDDEHWTVGIENADMPYPSVSVYLNGVRVAWEFGGCVYGGTPQEGLALTTGYECIVHEGDHTYRIYPDKGGPYEAVADILAAMEAVIAGKSPREEE